MDKFTEMRVEKIKLEAGLVDVVFPACCLSCDHNPENSDNCQKLNITIDNPFQICNYYKD